MKIGSFETYRKLQSIHIVQLWNYVCDILQVIRVTYIIIIYYRNRTQGTHTVKNKKEEK